MNVIPPDFVASTALMREALSAATARMATLWKQISVPARPQVSRDYVDLLYREHACSLGSCK